MRRTFLLAALGPLAVVALYACDDDDDNPTASITLDGGGPNLVDGSSRVPSVPGDDAGSTPTPEAGTDAGPTSDAGPLTTCAPSTKVAGHKIGAPITLEAYGDKTLVTWFEGTPSHLWGKWSGSATPIDLGVGSQQEVVTTVDATGKEYLLYNLVPSA